MTAPSTVDSFPFGALVRAVARRPDLWGAALVQAVRLAPPGWWRVGSHRPLPTPDLWRFRMETAYGGDGRAVPTADDIQAYLEWCRAMRHWRRR